MEHSFKIFAQLGYDVSIRFGHCINGKWEETELSHISFDGINGFTKLLTDQGKILPTSFPQLRERPERSFFQKWTNRFRQYFRTVGQFSKPSRQWRLKRAPLPAGTFVSSWRLLSVAETQLFRACSQSQGVSLNTFLLYNLHRAVLPFLEAGSKQKTLPCAWIVPAMLYKNWKMAANQGVHTSIMELNIIESDTPHSLQQKLNHEISIESYWGPILGAAINNFLPDFLNRFILNLTVAKKMRVGTFSNIGKWTGQEQEPSEGWSVLPPVHPGQPLGVGAIEYNGKLGLGIKADPVLGFSQSDIVQIFDHWYEFLMHQREVLK